MANPHAHCDDEEQPMIYFFLLRYASFTEGSFTTSQYERFVFPPLISGKQSMDLFAVSRHALAGQFDVAHCESCRGCLLLDASGALAGVAQVGGGVE